MHSFGALSNKFSSSPQVMATADIRSLIVLAGVFFYSLEGPMALVVEWLSGFHSSTQGHKRAAHRNETSD